LARRSWQLENLQKNMQGLVVIVNAEAERQRGKERGREAEREAERQRGRETGREAEIEAEREAERQRGREAERERGRETEAGRCLSLRPA
jgi:hypothetical protein